MSEIKTVKLNNLSASLGRYDLFVCSASFEERCILIAKQLKDNINSKAFICRNVDQISIVGTFTQKLEELWTNKAIPVPFISSNPLSIADSFANLIGFQSDSNHMPSIFVDITTFTHEALLIIFKILTENGQKFDLVSFGYVPASDYSTNITNPKEKRESELARLRDKELDREH